MPVLHIGIDDAVWPDVMRVLIGRFGEPEPGVMPRAFVEEIAVKAFADVVAEAARPPAPSTKSRIRPSRVHH